MSTYNDIDITCEKCGHEFRGTVWTAVHSRQDPELKDLLLGGELNMVMCPECTYVAYHECFVLYQDPSAELVAYVHPEAESSREKVLRETMLQGFREAQSVFEKSKRLSYDPVIFFGLASLVESMRREEARGEQSEVAEAFCREFKIPFLALSPSQARAHDLLPILPGDSDGKTIDRTNLLAGLKRLLVANPALRFYQEFLTEVQADPQWNMSKKEIL